MTTKRLIEVRKSDSAWDAAMTLLATIQQRDDMTTQEVDASLAEQVKRHAVLKAIIKQIEDFRKTDEEGADWILEKLAE